MRTVGEILKNKRLEKGFSLEDVQRATKIKKEILEAIEVNNFQEIPSEIAIQGFVKNYADFLGLSLNSISAIFRRDFSKNKRKYIRTSGIFLRRPREKWNPRLFLVLIVGIFSLGLIVYLIYRYYSLVKTPRLEIFFPSSNIQVSDEKIIVSGKVDSDCLLLINNNLVLVMPNGEFKYLLSLFPGENKIIIEAKNRIGKKSRVERSVFRLDNK